MTLSDLRAFITAQRALCDGATAGPWEVEWDSDTSRYEMGDIVRFPVGVKPVASYMEFDGLPNDDDKNAEFIAQSRTALPQALDHMERLLTVVEASVAYRKASIAFNKQPMLFGWGPVADAGNRWEAAVDAFIEAGR